MGRVKQNELVESRIRFMIDKLTMLSKAVVLFALIQVSLACFEQDTGYLGAPRGSNGVGRVDGIPTAYECQVACQNEPDCEFFVWNSPDWRSRQGRCYFKKNDNGRVQGPRQAGRISGPKFCDCFDYDTTIGRGKGNGAGRVNDVPSPLACQAECRNNADCTRWIWNSPEHERNPNVFWLKKAATEASVGTDFDLNRISGPAFCDDVPA